VLLVYSLASTLSLGAQPYWPGPTFLSWSSWGMEAVVPVPTGEAAGFGARAGFGLEGVEPLRGFGAGLGLAYRWHGMDGNGIASMFGGALGVSYRVPLIGPLSVRPALEAGVALELLPVPGSLTVDIGLELQLAFLIGGRAYCTIAPHVRWIPGFDSPFLIGAALGIRSEKAWLKLIPPPEPRLVGVLPLYSPDGDGLNDDFLVNFEYDSDLYMKSWSVQIIDADGNTFYEESGSGLPPAQFSWDGMSNDGRLVEPATDYRILASMEDAAGRVFSWSDAFTVDILVIKIGDRYKVRVPSILFPSNSAELGQSGTDWMVNTNEAVLKRLITLFSRFPDYSIIVEGHANSVYWADPVAFQREQAEELIPLSHSRATAVLEALVSMGIIRQRIRAVGIGGQEPLVVFSDSDYAWKNRRVEFILQKSD
jgi:outer membrane protein OmpA-like peptidoglycan-associated protein